MKISIMCQKLRGIYVIVYFYLFPFFSLNSFTMLCSKFAVCGRLKATALVTGAGRTVVTRQVTPNKLFGRLFQTESRSELGRHAKRKTLKERMMAPAGDTG